MRSLTWSVVVLAIGCNRESEPVAPPHPAPNPSAVVVTLDAGEEEDAADAAAPAASVSTTGEEGPANAAATPERTHVFVRTAGADEKKAASVDIYGDGSVWWKGPGCPNGVRRRIDVARVKAMVDELARRKFFDMQPVSGPTSECKTPGSVTVHADAMRRSAEWSANACSDAAQKRAVDDWKKRVLSVAGDEPDQCSKR